MVSSVACLANILATHVVFLFHCFLLADGSAVVGSLNDVKFLTQTIILPDGKKGTAYTLEQSQTLIKKTMEVECRIAKSRGLQCTNVTSSLFDHNDVVYNPDQLDSIIFDEQVDNQQIRDRRNMIVRPGILWNSKTFPYVLEDSIKNNSAALAALKGAFKIYHENTCVKFRPRISEESYIQFKSDGFWCSAYATPWTDSSGWWPQLWIVTLGDEACYDQVGTAWHEVAHVLGKHHEHMRPDRDQYVQIIDRNIQEGKLQQFHPACTQYCTTNDIPYDYGSAMHYSVQNKFRVEDRNNLLTIDPDYMDTIGSRYPGPSFYDLKAINVYYKCEDDLKKAGCKNIPDCLNGGIAHPIYCGWCLCPEGWVGRNCDHIEPGSPMGCGGELQAEVQWTNMSTPAYPEKMEPNQRCSWLIKAPLGKHVEFRFVGQVFELRLGERCEQGFVEVRYKDDLANTGPRFCRDKVPESSYVSEKEKLLVLLRFYTDNAAYRGFRAQYRIASV